MAINEGVSQTLSDLRDMGVSLALDDFGTGYSSLQSLRRQPVSLVKIDKSFVGDVPGGGEVLIKATVDVARHFGLGVVAEGVETAQQRAAGVAGRQLHAGLPVRAPDAGGGVRRLAGPARRQQRTRSAEGPERDERPEARRRTRRMRGFTLMELMLTVGLIGVLMGIAVLSYQSYRERMRENQAVREIAAMSADIQRFALDRRAFPRRWPTSARPGASTLGRPHVYNVDGERQGRRARDHKLNPLNTDFDLYSLGKDGKSKPQITQKDSVDDADPRQQRALRRQGLRFLGRAPCRNPRLRPDAGVPGWRGACSCCSCWSLLPLALTDWLASIATTGGRHAPDAGAPARHHAPHQPPGAGPDALRQGLARGAGRGATRSCRPAWAGCSATSCVSATSARRAGRRASPTSCCWPGRRALGAGRRRGRGASLRDRLRVDYSLPTQPRAMLARTATASWPGWPCSTAPTCGRRWPMPERTRPGGCATATVA